MPRDPDKYDFFVSYARADNHDGWISGIVDELLAAHRRFSGGREFVPFFDKQDIRNLDDWQHRLHDGKGHDLRLVRIHRLVQDLVRRELAVDEHVVRALAIEAFVTQREAVLRQTTRWQDARWEIEPLDALANLWADNEHPQAARLLNQAGRVENISPNGPAPSC